MTTRSASCGRQGFARFVSALVVCGTAALLCPPIVDALAHAASAENAALRAPRTSSPVLTPRAARPWKIDATVFHADVAAALLTESDLPPLPLGRHSITPPEAPADSRGEVRPVAERGPTDSSAAVSTVDEDDDDDDDQDHAFDASRASLTAAAYSAAFSSTTRRALHRSAGQHSVRAPPQ